MNAIVKRNWIRMPLLLWILGCSAVDFSREDAYYRMAPRSILILPLQNRTNDVVAPKIALATMVRHLIDKGYYVFPPDATMQVLEREGIHDAGEIWQTPPATFQKHFNADAVLYAQIDRWETVYAFLHSQVTVGLSYRLVDTATGTVLWENRAVETIQSGAHGDNLISLVVSAAVDAAVTAAFTNYFQLASHANERAFFPLLPGFHHPAYARWQRDIGEWKQARQEKR